MDKVTIQYNEKLFRSWVINPYTTAQVEPRANVDAVYSVAYNVKKVFKDGARTFSDFKDEPSENGRFYEEFYQFFWACVHRSWHTAKQGKWGQGHSAAPAPAPATAAGRGDASGGRAVSSFHTGAPPPGESRWNDEPAMEVYMEAVMPEPEPDAPEPEGAEGVVAYRFWVLMRSGSMDGCPESVLEETAELAKQGGRGKKKGGSSGEGLSLSVFEKYRKIRNKSDLAVLSDLYTDTQYMQNNMDAINDPGTPLTSANNPLCARTVFSPAFAFLHCGDGAAAEQGPSALNTYVQMEGRKATVVFPRPKFVMRMYPDQCSVETLSSKYLPHFQQACAHPIARAYPLFFPMARGLNAGLSKDELTSGQKLDKLQRDLGRFLAGEGDGDDDGFLDSSYDSVADAARAGGGAPGSFTARAAEVMKLEQLLPFFQLRDAERGFRVESLTIRQRLQDMQELVNSPLVQYYHKSELAQLADESKSVRGVIDKAFSVAVAEVDRLTRDPSTEEEWMDLTDMPSDPKKASPCHSVNKAREYCCRAKQRARIMYLLNQAQMFRQYGARCRSAQSNISDVGRAMHDYRVRNSIYDHCVKHYKIDRGLTTTNNLYISMVEQYQSVFYVSSKHVHLLICDLARLDASRHAFNLHWNVLTHSHEGGQSKSFVWSIIEEISIEGSTYTLTYQTRRADNVDGDKNDLIRIFNEVPHSMLFAGANASEDQTGPMKDLLTSCVSRVYLFDAKRYEETGARANRMAISECIGVWFGSYNDSPAKIEDAMRSRFTFLGCERTVDPARNTQDLMYAESLRAPGQAMVRKRTVAEKRLIQMMFFEVNKLIQVGALTEPSLEACTTVFLMVDHLLEKEGHRPPSGRLFEQQCVIARTLVIHDALDKHFFVPCAEHFGKPVTLEAFKGLDRKLVGFAHHAAMALSLTIDQLIDPLEAEVVSAIARFHAADHRYRNSFAKKRWAINDAQAVGQGQGARDPPAPPHVRKEHIYGTGAAGRLPDCGFVSRADYESDYSYISFDNLSGRSKNEAIRDFASTLSAFMDSGALGNRTKPPPQTIFEVVKGLKRRTFLCRAFRKSSTAGFSDVDAVEEDPDSAPEHRPICVDDRDSVGFLCAYVNRPVESGRQMLCRILKTVLGMRHQEKKTIVLGLAEDSAPNVLLTLDVGAPDPSSASLPDMAIPNAAYMSEMERVVVYGRADGPSVDPLKMKKSIIINVDLDLWAVSRRNDALFLSGYRVDPADVVSNMAAQRGGDGGAGGAVYEPWKRYFLGMDVTEPEGEDPGDPTPEQNLQDLASVRLHEFDGELPDYDMGDPASYTVTAEDGSRVPHWVALGNVEPYVYKLQREHWKITEHMESLVDYGDRQVFRYPQDLQSRGTTRQEAWADARSMSDNPESRRKTLQTSPECFVRGTPSMALFEPYNSFMNPSASFISSVPAPRAAPAHRPPASDGSEASNPDDPIESGGGHPDAPEVDAKPINGGDGEPSSRKRKPSSLSYNKRYSMESVYSQKALAQEMMEEAYGSLQEAKEIMKNAEKYSRRKLKSAAAAPRGKRAPARSEKTARAEERLEKLPAVKDVYKK